MVGLRGPDLGLSAPYPIVGYRCPLLQPGEDARLGLPEPVDDLLDDLGHDLDARPLDRGEVAQSPLAVRWRRSPVLCRLPAALSLSEGLSVRAVLCGERGLGGGQIGDR